MGLLGANGSETIIHTGRNSVVGLCGAGFVAVGGPGAPLRGDLEVGGGVQLKGAAAAGFALALPAGSAVCAVGGGVGFCEVDAVAELQARGQYHAIADIQVAVHGEAYGQGQDVHVRAVALPAAGGAAQRGAVLLA